MSRITNYTTKRLRPDRRAPLPARLRNRMTTPEPAITAYLRPPSGWNLGHYDGPTNDDKMALAGKRMSHGGSMIPPMYRNNPGGCYMLLLKALSLDIPRSTAVENIHWNPIIGKGALSAQLMAALLHRHGYEFRVTREDADEVHMDFYRLTGGQRKKLGSVSWTILEAVAANLSWRELWQQYPTDMLWARCLMRGARRYAQDVAAGMAYTVEELHDMSTPDEAEVVHPDVQTLVDQATTFDTTAEQIKHDITARAKQARLLTAFAGDGKTLGQVLGELWMEARCREADQVQTKVLPSAGDAMPRELEASAGSGVLPCGCDAEKVLMAGGQHQEGCKR